MILALWSEPPFRMVRKQTHENKSILTGDQWTKMLEKVSSKVCFHHSVYIQFHRTSELFTTSRRLFRMGWSLPRHQACYLQDFTKCGKRFDAGILFFKLR